jgi:lactoylglutathione lyase
MITAVDKIVMPVENQERAKTFWTTTVGFELRRDEAYGDERWIEVSPPDGGPSLVLSPRASDEQRRQVPDELPHSPVFFGCADIEATYRELTARGVSFPTPPQRQHFGWWSLFEDPDGTRHALGQWDTAQPHVEAAPEDRRLEALLGRWHTTGQTSPSPTNPSVEIDATDTYTWLPGRCGLLHTVDARVGAHTVRGAEIIGFDPSRGRYITQYFGNDGPNAYEADLTDQDAGLIWSMRSEHDRFTGTFSDDRTTITGHWEQLGDDGNWHAWMDVTLKRS